MFKHSTIQVALNRTKAATPISLPGPSFSKIGFSRPRLQGTEAGDVEIAKTKQRLQQCLFENGWELSQSKDGIKKRWTFRRFFQARAFVQEVLVSSQAFNHHPVLKNDGRLVIVEWTTHSASAITLTDTTMANICDTWAKNFDFGRDQSVRDIAPFKHVKLISTDVDRAGHESSAHPPAVEGDGLTDTEDLAVSHEDGAEPVEDAESVRFDTR